MYVPGTEKNFIKHLENQIHGCCQSTCDVGVNKIRSSEPRKVRGPADPGWLDRNMGVSLPVVALTCKGQDYIRG